VCRPSGSSTTVATREVHALPHRMSSLRRYIVTVSFFKDNLFVRAFHPPTRITIPYMIPMVKVLDVFAVPRSTHPSFYPGILHPDNRSLLAQWLVCELSLCRGYLCQVPSHAPLHMMKKPALMLEIIEVRAGAWLPESHHAVPVVSATDAAT
jgi:hypothetical protein